MTGKNLTKNFYNSYTPTKSYFPGTVYENPNNPMIEFDLDGAIKLLEEAGWTEKNSEGYRVKNGKVFEVELPFYQASQERYLTIFQEDLKKAGVKLNLKQIDGTTNFRIGNERNFNLITIAWGGQTPPNPELNVTSKTADDPNSTNWPGVKSARVDELVELYNTTFDKKERVKQMREIDSILVAQQPYVFGWYANYQRLIFHNKFGYPKWYISRFDDYYDGVEQAGVFSMWWVDPEKYAAYQMALNDKNKSLPVGEIDERFWVDLKTREENGETVMITTQQ